MNKYKTVIHNLIIFLVIIFFIMGSLSQCHKAITDFDRSDNVHEIVEMTQTKEYKKALIKYPDDSSLLSNIYVMTLKNQELILNDNITQELINQYDTTAFSLLKCSKILFNEMGENLLKRAKKDSIDTKAKKTMLMNYNKFKNSILSDSINLSRDECLEFLTK